MKKQINEKINNALKELYEKNKDKHIELWKDAYQYKGNNVTRLNQFGIIDVNRYDPQNGVLVICRETNGESWYENDFVGENALFVDWMREISINGLKNQKGCVKKHPTVWYNIARYIMTINGQRDQSLKCPKSEPLNVLGTVAFTNINKVGGGSSSGKSYWEMYDKADVINLIVEEIKIIEPKYIILCEKYFAEFLTDKNIVEGCPPLKKCIENNRFFTVYHPAARMSKEKMLDELEKQIKGEN